MPSVRFLHSDEALAVGQPLHLLHATEGTHGGFPLLVLHGVEGVLDLTVAEVTHEEVTVGVDPVVPVAVHQVVVDAARGLIEVGIDVGHGLFQLHLLGEEHLGAVGGIEETVDVVGFVGDALQAGAVGIHFPELHDIVFRGEEADLLSVGTPLWAVLTVIAHDQHFVVAAVGVHDIQGGAATVFGHAVVSHGIDDFLMVG